MSAPGISRMVPCRTAANSFQPGRLAMLSVCTGLPHHEARMISGSAPRTCSLETTRSGAERFSRSSGKMSSPPARSINSLTQPIPEICGSFHSSKYTRGRPTTFSTGASRSRNSRMKFLASASRSTMRPNSASVASISASVRWFVARTLNPRRMSSEASRA